MCKSGYLFGGISGFLVFLGEEERCRGSVRFCDRVDFPVGYQVATEDPGAMFQCIFIGLFVLCIKVAPVATVVAPHQFGEVKFLALSPFSHGSGGVCSTEFKTWSRRRFGLRVKSAHDHGSFGHGCRFFFEGALRAWCVGVK